MAEDETKGGFTEDEEDEQQAHGPAYYKSQPQQKKEKCNQRIDELAAPNRRMFLGLYNDHAGHLPKDKVTKLKEMLQQLYAMTPEETAKYFAELRAEAKSLAMRRKFKQALRRYVLEKKHEKERERAYRLFKKLLTCGIKYTAKNPVPSLLSMRLRYLSDMILEELCGLRGVEVPNRAHPDVQGQFLISVADWIAIAVERLYYAAQKSINEITEERHTDPGYEVSTQPQPAPSAEPLYSFEESFKPIAASSPRTSKQNDAFPVSSKRASLEKEPSFRLPPDTQHVSRRGSLSKHSTVKKSRRK